MSIKKQNIAIIGAGISGLTLANMLHGLAYVEVFEKSRGYGGRLATHYDGDFEFDHGAQFFTAKSDKFKAFIQPLIDAEVIGIWNARFVEIDNGRILHRKNWDTEYPHYVGIPRMNAIGKYLAKDISIRLCTEVSRIEKSAATERWKLSDIQNNYLGSFDWVVCSTPAYQTQKILPEVFAYHSELKSRHMLGCYALMLGFEDNLNMSWDAALVKNAILSWISFNTNKPGRKPQNTIITLASNKWADSNMDADLETVKEEMLETLSRIIRFNPQDIVNSTLRKWRFANISKHINFKYLLDKQAKLAAIGDWCTQGRVENAFMSAENLYNEIIQLI